MSDEALLKYGTLAKMNPPLRSEADRKATIAAIADGTVDLLATDHAPHTLAEKELGFLEAPNGIIGLECAYGVCHKVLVDGGFISDERLIELMSVGPAELMGHVPTDVAALVEDYAEPAPTGDDPDGVIAGESDAQPQREGVNRLLDLSRVDDADNVDLVVLNTAEEWTVDPEHPVRRLAGHRTPPRHNHRLPADVQPSVDNTRSSMDRLIEAIDNTQNPSVVGLDPTEALVPPQVVASFADEVRDSVESPEEVESAQLAVAYFEYNRTIIDAIADIVPAVKPQIAMYEALGPAGVDIYTMTCEYAAQQGLYVLGDIKRGDIGSTAAAYAHHLNGVGDFDPWHEDAVTVNPYLGTDGITPFVEAAAEADKDIFVLVRTSNPSSSELQMLDLADGTKVYEHVADLVEGWGAETIGSHGYSRVGAVVGATHPEEGKALRARMPHTFFLVPGYGAQGGTAADVAGMFDKQGSGAIVNSSRGIIGAWKKSGKYSESMTADEALDLVASSARQAALDMRDNLRVAVYR